MADDRHHIVLVRQHDGHHAARAGGQEHLLGDRQRQELLLREEIRVAQRPLAEEGRIVLPERVRVHVPGEGLHRLAAPCRIVLH